MRENLIETKLKKQIEHLGGKCKKFISPGSSGEPDRICLFPGGRVFFVETKAPGKKPRPLQKKRHEELRKMGFKVFIVDSKEDIDEIQAP